MVIVSAAKLPVHTEREGVGDVVRSDRAMKHRVEHTVEATAEYKVDAFEAQVVASLYVEA